MYVRIDDYPEDCEQERFIDVQVEDFDVFSMDTQLAHVIVPMLKLLREKKAGIPGDIINTFHECSDQLELDFGLTPKEIDEIEFECAEKKWNDILDKMIWSFEQAMNDYPLMYSSMSKGDFERYEERMQEGFELFGRYYRSLWY
jgi:hypothetical protein